jgi:ribonucleoside-diphosphate reductase alpha chain
LICGTIRAALPDEKTKRVREKNRRIGLGLMGVHEWMLQHGTHYEVSPELHEWLEVYRDESEEAADDLCDRHSLSRPAGYRAVAPTGTIGTMAGTTTGMEPIFAVAYKRRYLEKVNDGRSEVRHFQYVIDSSAQDLSDRLGVNPDTIETSLDLAHEPERRLAVQADIQDYVDMGISSTINLPAWGDPDNNPDRVEDTARSIARYAPRLRGLTFYPDGSRGGQPLVRVPYAEAHGKAGQVFEENGDRSCKSGVCGI